MHLLLIGFFGGLGCLSRYLVANTVHQLVGRGLPFGTLFVNTLGSFMLALLMVASLKSTLLPADLRLGLTVGFMGGFTTFSTFSYETMRLLEDGQLWQAGANIALNLGCCLLFTLLGLWLGRFLFSS